jgi:hypothetical protein
MVLLRWCVGASNVPGGAVGGARFGVLAPPQQEMNIR